MVPSKVIGSSKLSVVSSDGLVLLVSVSATNGAFEICGVGVLVVGLGQSDCCWQIWNRRMVMVSRVFPFSIFRWYCCRSAFLNLGTQMFLLLGLFLELHRFWCGMGNYHRLGIVFG